MDTKKLRQKILDLAIRGKLVPQDPNDEPASVLLERIRAEKERLIKEGKIKRSKKFATDTTNEEVPFEIPDSWEWTTVGDICNTCLGKMLDKQKNQGTNQYYLRNINVRWGAFDLSDLLQMPFEEDEEERYSICKGDLVVCEGGEPGRCAIWDSNESIKFQKALHRVRCNNGVNNRYIRYALELYAVNGFLEKFYTGSTIKHLTGEALNSLSIPLPPLAEQKRIVDETERWFAVIDALESNEGDLLKAIELAKSKILDLAIHGKLVPQDPNDEPALELLKRINPRFEPCDVEDCPFEIPQSWEWTTIGECSIYKSASIDPSKYKDQEFELYSVPSFETGMPEVVKGAFISSSKKMVEEGDVLLCKINPHLNRTWVVEHHKKDLQCIASSEWIIFRNRDINSQYLMRCFTSSYFLNLMLSNVSGVGGSLMRAQPASVEKYLFPLPPLAEQVRIVSKMEELFSVLDSIKESLE